MRHNFKKAYLRSLNKIESMTQGTFKVMYTYSEPSISFLTVSIAPLVNAYNLIKLLIKLLVKTGRFELNISRSFKNFCFFKKAFSNAFFDKIGQFDPTYFFKITFSFIFHIKGVVNLVYKSFEFVKCFTNKRHTTKIGNNSYNEDWKFNCDFGVIFYIIKGNLALFEVKRGS